MHEPILPPRRPDIKRIPAASWALAVLVASSLTACAGTAPHASSKGEHAMEIGTVKRSLFQRLLGIPATPPPHDQACWTYADGVVTIDLQRAAELDRPGGAMRLEGDRLPQRVLVYRDQEGEYHAVRNRCTHAGRRLDPVPGAHAVQCCSMGKSTFDAEGQAIRGAASKPIDVYPVAVDDGKLLVTLSADE